MTSTAAPIKPSMDFPHVVSAVNGLYIPLLPGQEGILHRFTNPENQLVFARVSESKTRDTATTLVSPASADEVPLL